VRELLGKVLAADSHHHKALHLLALVEAGGDHDAKLRARQLWRCSSRTLSAQPLDWMDEAGPTALLVAAALPYMM
jgi:hypothetical protein